VAVAEHLIAITRFGDRSLTEPDRGFWLFDHLRRVLVGVLSLVLMPDHLHLVAAVGQWMRLRRVLNGFTCRFGVRFDVKPSEPAHTRAIAGRQMRYGFRNAVAAGLVDDPWRWPFSTLRDLGGATYPLWTPLPDVARHLQLPPRDAMRALTAMADVAVPPLVTTVPAAVSLPEIETAIASALRFDPRGRLDQPLGRTLAVQAMGEFGHPNQSALAQWLGCSTRTVRRVRAPRHPALDAVLKCLADPRLRTVLPPANGRDLDRIGDTIGGVGRRGAIAQPIRGRI
jgi:hypothetical protein